MTNPEMKELIDFLRAEGVTLYEKDGVRLTILPERPESLAPFEPSAKLLKKDKRYNMTENEQLEMFGEVVSAVE